MLFSRLKKRMRNMPNAADGHTVITGNIRSENGWTVSGTLIGDLVALGDVVIGPSAEIRGNVSGLNVWIAGKVNGHVEARHHLHLASSCSIDGIVSYQTIQIEEGAHVSGGMELAKPSAGKDAEAQDAVPSVVRIPIRERVPNDVRTHDQSQTHSQTLSHSHPQSHPHPHSRSHPQSQSRSHSLPQSHPNSHTHSHPQSHPSSHSRGQTPLHSHSHGQAHSHSPLHAHAHAHSEEEASHAVPNPFTVLPLKDDSPIPVRHKRLMIQ